VARAAAFRDALRADPQLAARYQELKRQLARAAADITAYTEGKRAFAAAALAAAGGASRRCGISRRNAGRLSLDRGACPVAPGLTRLPSGCAASVLAGL
jgi:hypothetical protein